MGHACAAIRFGITARGGVLIVVGCCGRGARGILSFMAMGGGLVRPARRLEGAGSGKSMSAIRHMVSDGEGTLCNSCSFALRGIRSRAIKIKAKVVHFCT